MEHAEHGDFYKADKQRQFTFEVRKLMEYEAFTVPVPAMRRALRALASLLGSSQSASLAETVLNSPGPYPRYTARTWLRHHVPIQIPAMRRGLKSLRYLA